MPDCLARSISVQGSDLGSTSAMTMATRKTGRPDAVNEVPRGRVSTQVESASGADIAKVPSLSDALALAIRLAVQRQARLRTEARRTIKVLK